MRPLRAIPSYYLRYYYATDEVLARAARRAPPRAQEVMDIERELLELYRDPTLDTKPELLEHRGGAFYSEAAAQLIASLHDGRGDVQVVDIRTTDGALPDLPDDAVVEVPARITRDGAEPSAAGAAGAGDARPGRSRAQAYEELTIAGGEDRRSRRLALRALLANPLVARWSTAEPLLDALLEANRPHLPRFFPDCRSRNL